MTSSSRLVTRRGGGARDATVATTGTAVAALTSTVTGFVLARELGPDDFGRYSIAFAVTGTIAMVARLGMDRAGIRLLGLAMLAPQPPVAVGKAVSAVCTICATGAAGGGLVSAVVMALGSGVFFDDASLGDIALAVGCWTTAETLHVPLAELHRGRSDIVRATVFGRPLRNAGFAVVVVAIVVTGGQLSLESTVWISAAVTACTALASSGSARLARFSAMSGRDLRETARLGLPLMVGGAGAYVLANGDGFLVGGLADPSAAGIYGAALRIAAVLGLPMLAVNAVLSPAIVARHHLDDIAGLERLVRRSTTMATVPVFAATVLLAIAGDSLASLAYGGSYENAGRVAFILAVGQLFNVAMGPCGTVLSMTGFERVSMSVTGSAALLMTLGVVIGGSGLTIEGVATIAALASIGQNVVLVVLAQEKLGVRTYVSLTRRA